MTLSSKIARISVRPIHPFRRKINFMNMTSKSIGALSEENLRATLIARSVDLGGKLSNAGLVQKALNV